MILVTGATGNTGGRVAARLAERGLDVRTASRTGPTDVRFDWADESTHAKALENVTAAYLVAPVGVPDPHEVISDFVDRALEAGVRRIVLLSSSAIAEGDPGLGKAHVAVRERVPEWAVLRPSWFMQNFSGEHFHAASIASESAIYTATGAGRVAFVDAGDIADVAVHALTDPTPHNTDHVITGPAPLSCDEVAAQISERLNRRIRHISLDARSARARLESVGFAPGFAALLVDLDLRIAQGSEDRTTTTVLDVAGHRPRSFAAHLRAIGN
ncbi:NmrA family NAD(P)-binding protein [Spirillospora sp. CA-294931]|uniref:NmrA family NAD(P)-binding protein n=1 Tax=Spirillospora sp. CA-294931 TaxID=3240042 RepID=UPI003D91029C